MLLAGRAVRLCNSHRLFGSESTLNFNGTTSTVDTLTSVDGLGRTHVTQQRQTQGGTNYDSVETDYDAEGRPYQVTVPYTAAAGVTNAGATRTTTAHDSLGRPTLVTDGGGGTTTYTYLQTPGSSPVGFDVLVAVSGTSSQTFTRQLEYDGLGRLTSVCEVTSATGSASCGQSVAATGYLTKYTYDVLNDLLTVTQNAKGATTQTRTYAYDGLGRMTSEKNPETNQTAYTYTFDTDSTCGTSDGDMVKRIDPQGTVTCYAYDALHRLTSATYPSGGYYLVTPPKYYTYDSATVDGASMSYAKGRLAEAYTGSSKTTDLGFSYSKRGEVSDVYQYSPHSGTNYYYHAAATYWAPQGLPATLNPNMSDIPTWTYTPDGEGRVNTVAGPTGTNLVSATSYNGFSEPTGMTFGSADADAFSYDATTGRMTQYKATINGSAVFGTLTWNANWTLKTLATTDPYNTGNNGKTCSYTYDDMARLSQADCGSGNWGQSFSYLDAPTGSTGAFGNISKSVLSGRTGQSFSATYSDTTNRLTTTGVTYDSNGNLTYDGAVHHYTWDGEGNLATLDGNGETYDALNHRVEQYNGSAYTEIVYSVDGSKLALMSGQTVTKVFAPLSGGATAVYTSSGLAYYRHPDWLGSSRLASTPSRGVFYDGAYAPYGEPYVETGGTTDRNFTGQNQDLTPGSTGYLYDFLYREYHSTEGRWMSPDPAGMAAVDPTNPQSWNRYAYVGSNPLSSVDPSGLVAYCPWGTVPGQNVCAPPPPITIFLSSCSQAQLIDPSIPCGYPVSVPAVGQQSGGGSSGVAILSVAQTNLPAACQGVTAGMFDYTTPQTYIGENGTKTTLSAQQHITQAHIYPGEAGNTMYIISPWPGAGAAFQQVKLYNAATFSYGQPSQLGNGKIAFTLTFPVMLNPYYGLEGVIGADLYAPQGVQPLNTNKLILNSDCRLVRTSYPIK